MQSISFFCYHPSNRSEPSQVYDLPLPIAFILVIVIIFESVRRFGVVQWAPLKSANTLKLGMDFYEFESLNTN